MQNSKTNAVIALAVGGIAAAALILTGDMSFASDQSRTVAIQSHHVVTRRPVPTRPRTLYEIYDSLKGKRWCHLPSVPCDNTERIRS